MRIDIHLRQDDEGGVAFFGPDHVFENVEIGNEVPARVIDDPEFCWNCGDPANHFEMGVWGIFPHENSFFCSENCRGEWLRRNDWECPRNNEIWTVNGWIFCQGPQGFARCPECESQLHDKE